MATTVNCKGCGAELSDDRKICPHCQTPIVTAATAALAQATDEREQGYIKQIVRLDQEIGRLSDDNKRLLKENSDLRAANEQLLKQTAPAASVPVVEKTGPGVVTNSEANDATVENSLAAAGPTPVQTPTKDMKTL